MTPPPAGYTKLPAGVRCRCVYLWSSPDTDENWCCNKTPLAPLPAPKIKLCIDCRHLYTRYESVDPNLRPFPVLTCRALDGQTSPVTGERMGPISDAQTIRMSSLCGWTEAKLFQPKDKPSP